MADGLVAHALGEVRDRGHGGHPEPAVAGHDRLVDGGHADGVGAHRAERADLGRRLEARAAHGEVDALGERDAELGVLPLSEVLPIKGAEPMIFPAEVQQYIVMAGGVSAGSRLAAARDLMKYVTGPAALPVIKAKGMEK